MTTQNKSTLNALTKTLFIGSTLLVTAACSPAGTSFSSMGDQLRSAAMSDVGSSHLISDVASSPAVSGSIPVSGSASSGSIKQAIDVSNLVPSTPITQGVRVVEEIPFSMGLNTNDCIDYDGDDLKFELVKDSGNKIKSAQITSLPMTAKGEFDYGNYTAYALYKYEGSDEMRIEKVDNELTVAGERVYGYYNCLFQTMAIKETSDALQIPWKDVAKQTVLHLKTDYQEGLVGFAIRNQSTNTLSMRCYK